MNIKEISQKVTHLYGAGIVSEEEKAQFDELLRMRLLLKDVLGGYANVPIWNISSYDNMRKAEHRDGRIKEHMEKTRQLIKLMESGND